MKNTDAAVKILSDAESRCYLGLRILQRVKDYLRDPEGWMRYRDAGIRTPTARFWEDL